MECRGINDSAYSPDKSYLHVYGLAFDLSNFCLLIITSLSTSCLDHATMGSKGMEENIED